MAEINYRDHAAKQSSVPVSIVLVSGVFGVLVALMWSFQQMHLVRLFNDRVETAYIVLGVSSLVALVGCLIAVKNMLADWHCNIRNLIVINYIGMTLSVSSLLLNFANLVFDPKPSILIGKKSNSLGMGPSRPSNTMPDQVTQMHYLMSACQDYYYSTGHYPESKKKIADLVRLRIPEIDSLIGFYNYFGEDVPDMSSPQLGLIGPDSFVVLMIDKRPYPGDKIVVGIAAGRGHGDSDAVRRSYCDLMFSESNGVRKELHLPQIAYSVK